MSTPLPEGTVTVLFTDLVGSTRLNQRLGDEAANTIERRVERAALDQIEKQRGVVVKDTGDGVMAAFQSARRAVSCAREIQRAMARHARAHPDEAVEMRIGLHTGEVIEESGNLHGETVIVAKRIESLAPAGGIFASETVHGVLGTARLELEDRGEFALKGLDVPWRLYEIPCAEEAGSVLGDQEPTPFVGRTGERERLLALLGRTQEGSGAIALLSGEAGSGKTRLTEELGAEAERRGLQVLRGHCFDVDAPPPYQPLVEQIEQASRAVSADALRDALGANAPEVAKLMPELRQRFPDIPDPPTLPPEQERRYVLHGVREFIERVSRTRPLVLVFEDLHWADESTLLLLGHLAARIDEMPVLLIGTYRHTELSASRPFSRALEDLLRARRAEEVALTALGEADVAALLQGRSGQPPPPELVRLVYSETEGNPFFVEELFRHLKELGKLFDERGQWRAGFAIADTEVPRGVRLVIGRRLENVSDSCRKVLGAAAVGGRLFSFELVRRIVGVDEDDLLDALEEAERAYLVEDRSLEREARYAFVHEQIRQTLLSAFSLPRRQRLHLRIADALQEIHGERADANELAHHLFQAGSAAGPDRTREALQRAAERALDALAFEDALRHVDAAEKVLDEGLRASRTSLLELRARALRGSARMDDALAALAEALELAPERRSRNLLLHQRARLLLDLFRGAEALEDILTLLASARDDGDREGELELLLDLGRAHYILSLDDQGYAQPARDSYESAYALAKELGDKRAMVRSLTPTSWFTDYWPEYRSQAIANSAEALALVEELGDENLRIDASTARLRLMAPSEAAEEAEALRQRLEQSRDIVKLKEHTFWLMWQNWARGALETAVESCDRGIELAEQLGSPPVQYGGIKAIALVDLGRFDQVEAALAQEVTDDDHPFGQAMAVFARANFLERIDARDAADVALDAIQRAEQLSRIWMRSWLLGTLATLTARRGDAGGALREEIARQEAAGFSIPTDRSAELLLADGDTETACRQLASAFEGQERVGLYRHAVTTLEVLARAELAAGRCDEAAERARSGGERAARIGFASLEWRLRAIHAQALDGLGRSEEAGAERAAAKGVFDTLIERLPEGDRRKDFGAQPLAAALLAGQTTRRGEG